MLDLTEYLAKPDETIREHTNNLLKDLETIYELGYIKDERIYRLAKGACEYHDYGKVNKYFQERVSSPKKIKFDDEKEIAHNILSSIFIDEDDFDNLRDYLIVLNAVLNHHSRINNLNYLSKLTKRTPILKKNLEGFEKERINISDELDELEKLIMSKDNKDLVLVKGLLHRCDYSASSRIDGNRNFKVEYPNNFLLNNLDNFMNNMGYRLNDLQKYCRDNSEKNIVGVAQTGMGKTEAGLYWIGNNKGFFVLPLKTAINAIYQRCKNDFIDKNNINKQLGLLHGDNLAYYIDNSKEENKSKDAEVEAFEYYNITKKFSQPINISTPDQLFDFIFKYNGYEFKATILAYSKIVIDEIQMYSPELLSYIINGLKVVNDLGGKFCILTATFPPFVRDLFEAEEVHIEDHKEFVNNQIRHFIEVKEEELDVNLIRENYSSKKGKVLVVCNTIKKAQEVYEELKDLENINLFHSRFIKSDRSEKEKKILNFAENNSNRRNNNDGIWISTQVVEASLDIDFDYLYTELSEINGLFQRLGRCNRSGRNQNLIKPNCFVFTEINHRLLDVIVSKEIYQISKEAILKVFLEPKTITEREKIDIINKYFTTENLNRNGNSKYLSDFKYSSNKLKYLTQGSLKKDDAKKLFRDIHNVDIIPYSIYDTNKENIENCLEIIEKKENKIGVIEAKEYIKKLSVSIASYAFDEKEAIPIKIDKYNTIYKVDVKYSKERGVEFDKNSRKKYKKIIEDENDLEEEFNNFL